MLRIFSIAMISLFALSCNEGVEGFNAPSGATVTVTSVGAISVDSAETVTAKIDLHANGLQIKLTCIDCTFTDSDPPGYVGDSTDLSSLTSQTNPYFVKSGSRGYYDIGVLLQPPSAVNGTTKYTARVIADIGVASSTASIAVTQQ